MTRLIWSHSQLNVPSANISTFLRLKSIAIIFLRPSFTHTHTHTHTRPHAWVHFFLFRLSFNLIGICVACCSWNNWPWMCTSVWNNTLRSSHNVHILLVLSSLDWIYWSFPSKVVDLRFVFCFFFPVFWLSDQSIFFYLFFFLDARETTHTRTGLHFTSIKLQVELRDGRHSAFSHTLQTHLTEHCDWFRTDGAEVTVSDALLLMYLNEIITQPFCSSSGQPVS